MQNDVGLNKSINKSKKGSIKVFLSRIGEKLAKIWTSKAKEQILPPQIYDITKYYQRYEQMDNIY